jgi:mannose-6-phosphate isomerase-like protein (cupin superfamily)
MHTPRESATPTTGVQVLRVSEDTELRQTFFREQTPGTHVGDCGAVELGPAGGACRAALTLAFAVTEPGAIFPWQYHTCGTEIAFIVQGEGAIEVGEDGTIEDAYPFAAGDLVLIGPDVIYRVRNSSDTTPLRAWVGFPLGIHSFWPDGREAR